MTKGAPTEYRAKLTDDSGVIRGKIPSPLVRALGGRPGDYMVFRSDAAGKVSIAVSRARSGTKKPTRRKSGR
jgi:hypothetical protein